MVGRIFVGFIVLVLVELTSLLLLSKYTSVAFTVLFVIATGVLGTLLLRLQSWQAWRKVQRDLDEGRLPGESLADGLMVLIAAVLLIVPGLVTDVIGFSLLIPACRRWYRAALMRWFQRRVEAKYGRFAQRSEQQVEVIESYVVTNPPEEDPPAAPKPEESGPR